MGKSWLACALAHQACRDGFSALYLRLPRLLHDIAIARGDATYPKLLASFAKLDLLVLDDFGLAKLNADHRRDLLEILEDRYATRSTLVTSQLPLEKWHDLFGDPTFADAKGEPARPVASLAPETVTDSAMRRYPTLSNVYLHEVLDQWFEHEVKPRLRGRAFEVRYADDAVLVFEHEDDARRVLGVLAKRLEKYGLRLHPDKTRMVEFCRPSKSQRGGSQPGRAMRATIEPMAAARSDGPIPNSCRHERSPSRSIAHSPTCSTPTERGRVSSRESTSTC